MAPKAAGFALVLAALAARPARAQAPALPVTPLVTLPRERGAFVLRVEGNAAANFTFLGGHETNASFWGATLGVDVSQSFTIEGTFGYGSDRTTSSTGTFDTSPGYAFMLQPRFAIPSASGRHAFTMGAGPFVLTGGFQGTAVLAHAELAYEYRFPGGFSFLIGYGRDVALNTPPANEVCGEGWFSKCEETFKAGDNIGHFRIAIGLVVPRGGWPTHVDPDPPPPPAPEPLPPAPPFLD
jgi:hypothetical protein